MLTDNKKQNSSTPTSPASLHSPSRIIILKLGRLEQIAGGTKAKEKVGNYFKKKKDKVAPRCSK